MIGLGTDVLEHLPVSHLGHHAFPRHVVGLQEGVEALDAKANRTLAMRLVDRLVHRIRRAVDEVLQDVVEEPHHVLDEHRMVAPVEPVFEVQR